MTSKRSYLDNLNAGRQRRPGPALDEISRTLNHLEGRLGGAAGKPDRRSQEEAEIIRRMERLSNRASALRGVEEQQPARTEPSHAHLERIAREIENSRRQEDQLASVGNIAAELKALRDDMRGTVDSGLQREFDAIREQLTRVTTSAPKAAPPRQLHAEIDRLSDAIDKHAQRGDDKSTKLLHLELEEVKAALGNIAREDTARSMEGRVRGSDLTLERFGARLEEISAAISRLPDSESIRSLEDRVRTLAIALDKFAEQRDKNGPDLYAMVEDRLDEISRAISASAALAHSSSFDASHLDRIESRIASLAGQLDELAQSKPEGLIVERLGSLSERMDEIARRIDVPEQAMGRMTGLIAQISEKLDAAPPQRQTDRLFRGLEDRFAHLSDLIGRRAQDAIQQGNVLFQDLERRLEDMADRLDRGTSTIDAESGLMAALDAHFAQLAAQLENSRHPGGDAPTLHSLEARLEDISGRLQNPAFASAVDPEVFKNLEKQVSTLAEHMAQPGRDVPAFDDLAPRLQKIEQSIEENRASVLEAARRAAEEVAARLTSGRTHPVDDRLKAEFEKLQTLTRKSDERNTKTFEAIHDTLLKIVNRLNSLESGNDDHTAEAKLSFDQAEPARRTPADAAMAAADAALAEATFAGATPQDEGEEDQQPQQLLASLSRAFSARRGNVEAPRAEPVLSEEDPEVDTARLHEPLEPGSGVPDINAIMRRVRDQYEARERPTEAEKSDFIAAARRAAQAAAADAALEGKDNPPKKDRKRGATLRRRKKQLLLTMAATVFIASGLYFGRPLVENMEGMTLLSQLEDFARKPAVADQPLDQQVTSNVQPQPAAAEPVAEVPEPEVTELPDDTVFQQRLAERPDNTDQAMAEDSIGEVISSHTAEVAPASMPDLQYSMEPQTVSQPEPVATPIADMGPQLPEIPPELEPAVLREAAANRSSEAYYEIASRLAEGRGVAVNMGLAAKWYELAAEQGLAVAQYRLGNLYEKGMGLERNLSRAKMWYQLAAEQGNANAMHNLGVLYAMGVDGAADNATAARWFQEAADLGVTDSQFNLGILAAKGVGIPLDLVEAYKWFDIVARSGDEDAAAKRDEIAKTMSPSDLEQAKGKAKLWTAREANPIANMVAIPPDWKHQAERPSSTDITASVDMKKAVSNVQLILNKIGLDAGPADGVMGAKTRSAIRSFQQQNGLAETGEIDEPLVRALLERNGEAGGNAIAQ